MKNLIFILFISISVFSCQSNDSTIEIGNDIWMTENLSVKKFNNGDPIPEAKTEEEWLKAGQDKLPAWCVQNNRKENEKAYGILYNYYAIIDPRGLIPKGYRLPSDLEWTNLVNNVGGSEIAGKKLKNADFGGIREGNEFEKFNAKPGGVRTFSGSFMNENKAVYFWTSTEESLANYYYYQIYIDNDKIIKNFAFLNYGMYVRCIKEKAK